MAIAVEMVFPGATLAQYDQVLTKMGLTPGGKAAPGGISHFATEKDGDLYVVDVWESKEQFEHFAQEQIGPYSREAGFPNEPQLRFYDVHSYLTP